LADSLDLASIDYTQTLRIEYRKTKPGKSMDMTGTPELVFSKQENECMHRISLEYLPGYLETFWTKLDCYPSGCSCRRVVSGNNMWTI